MMVVVVLVVFCYFGGKYCPSALKKNKEMLLGVAGGLVLCSFFGLRLEGYGSKQDQQRWIDAGCCRYHGQGDHRWDRFPSTMNADAYDRDQSDGQMGHSSCQDYIDDVESNQLKGGQIDMRSWTRQWCIGD